MNIIVKVVKKAIIDICIMANAFANKDLRKCIKEVYSVINVIHTVEIVYFNVLITQKQMKKLNHAKLPTISSLITIF